MTAGERAMWKVGENEGYEDDGGYFFDFHVCVYGVCVYVVGGVNIFVCIIEKSPKTKSPSFFQEQFFKSKDESNIFETYLDKRERKSDDGRVMIRELICRFLLLQKVY